jgi:valyl-tRNA synthetase
LERLLILWHPFCPYVTEVLWEEFKTKELLMVQQWPKVAIRDSLLATRDFKTIKEVVTAIRNIRSEHKIDPKKVYSCSIQTENQQVISNNQAIIEGLAKVKITPKCSGLVIHTYEAEIVLDITQNKTAVKNQQKEIVNLKRYIEIQEKKLVNKEFIKKAPKAVVEQEKEKLQQAQEKLNKLIN